MNNAKSKTTKFLFLFCVNVFLGGMLFGQNVKVTGIAEGQENELVRIITYDDQFSKLEKTIATTTTDVDGNFSLQFTTDQTLFSYLAVGLKRGEFYLSPNATYQFYVLPDTNTQRGSIFDELPLQFTYKIEDGGLSDDIGSFNVQYNTFLYQYASRIYYGRDKSFIIDFETKIEEQFNTFNNAYLKTYIRYSFASLEWTSKMKSNDSIITKYFAGNPILYNNIQYAEFFFDFFKTYFIADKIFAYHEMITAINEDGSIKAIKSLIERNENLKQDRQLTELIAILLLSKKYYNPDVKRTKVLEMLLDIEENYLFAENKKVVSNSIKKLQNLESGTKAPEFILKDKGNNEYCLADFSGKFILLSFIKPDCRICLDHLHLLDQTVKKFNNKVQNLTLVFGDGFSDVTKYAEERDFDWPFLNLENNILLLEDYNIRAYPSYIIINPDGTIAMATAPMPDENLDLYLNRQIKRFENERE